MCETNQDMQENVCNCLKLRRASQTITKLYDKFLETTGIKISQYSLIKTIHVLEPVNVSDLANEVKLDRTTLVRNLKPLEEKGLVADISQKGTRNRQLVLTDAGKSTYRTAVSLWGQAQQFMKDALGPEDLSALLSLLTKVEKIDVSKLL